MACSCKGMGTTGAPVPVVSGSYDAQGRKMDEKRSAELLRITGKCWDRAAAEQGACVFNSGLVYSYRVAEKGMIGMGVAAALAFAVGILVGRRTK